MAQALDISASYLNLIERDQRSLPSNLLVKLAERFDFDPRSLAGIEPGGGTEALRRRLADPMFADLEIDRHEIAEWLAAAPGGAEAFARAFDRASGGTHTTPGPDDPIVAVRREIERWRNHFPDLDAAAETLAEELRLVGADMFGALVDRLRIKHGIALRVLPAEIMPDVLRRLDLHARQLQLNEMLEASGRAYAVAVQIAQLEARGEIDALARGAGFTDRVAERLFRRHLHGYFAIALMMPYARFLRACETTGYDVDILQRRFGTGFEQIAHRLTTLQRVGGRGLPFFMIRVDRTGQCSRRFAGASGAALVDAEERCPLWRLHHAFDRPGSETLHLVELEDGSRWFTQARVVRAPGGRAGGGAGGARADVPAEFAIGIGLAADQARTLAAARSVDLAGIATPIGLGCVACLRKNCPQRSAAPIGRALVVGERERGVSAFSFVRERD